MEDIDFSTPELIDHGANEILNDDQKQIVEQMQERFTAFAKEIEAMLKPAGLFASFSIGIGRIEDYMIAKQAYDEMEEKLKAQRAQRLT